jgi:hypothetical protein
MILTILIATTSIISIGAAVLDYRTNRSFIRSLLVLLSGVMLIGFIITQNRSDNASGQVVLLTDGATESDIEKYSESKIYSVESAEGVHSENEDVRWLSSVAMLEEVEERGQTVEMFGFGTRENLEGDFQWVDQLKDPGQGILLESAPQQITAGSQFQIKGRVITESGADTISLYRDGDQVQQQLVDEEGRFAFTDRLQVEGPASYQIEVDAIDTVISDTWHVRSVEPDFLSVAVMLYSPSFEVTHLSEWLGNRGHSLAIKTRVGDGRFRYDDINDPPASASNLIGNLSLFDLVLLDPREVSELSDMQIQSAREAVESGLDIILLPPSENNRDQWEEAMNLLTGEQIALSTISRIDERQWSPDIVDMSEQDNRVNVRLSLLNFSFDGLSESSEIFGRFENRAPVIVRIPAGRGSVSSHLFYQTYSWKLRGDMDLYADFWAGYLDRVITLETPFVEVSSMIPMRFDRLTLTSSGRSITVQDISQNQSSEIPRVSGFEHPGVNYGYYWPRSPGWHIAETEEANRWFYVYDSGETWSFTENYRRFQATSSEISNLRLHQDNDDTPVEDPVSARWWLIGFLIFQVILWAERKVNQ